MRVKSFLRSCVVVAGLLTPAAALAVDPSGSGEPAAPSGEMKTLSDYLTDLGSDDAPQRLYAARTVRFETRRALKAVAHAAPESLAALDAQSTLVELEARAPRACVAALHYPNTAVICAEILVDLERKDLLPDVQAARTIVVGKGPLKRFDKAAAALAALPDAPAP